MRNLKDRDIGKDIEIAIIRGLDLIHELPFWLLGFFLILFFHYSSQIKPFSEDDCFIIWKNGHLPSSRSHWSRAYVFLIRQRNAGSPKRNLLGLIDTGMVLRAYDGKHAIAPHAEFLPVLTNGVKCFETFKRSPILLRCLHSQRVRWSVINLFIYLDHRPRTTQDIQWNEMNYWSNGWTFRRKNWFV